MKDGCWKEGGREAGFAVTGTTDGWYPGRTAQGASHHSLWLYLLLMGNRCGKQILSACAWYGMLWPGGWNLREMLALWLEQIANRRCGTWQAQEHLLWLVFQLSAYLVFWASTQLCFLLSLPLVSHTFSDTFSASPPSILSILQESLLPQQLPHPYVYPRLFPSAHGLCHHTHLDSTTLMEH